MLTGAKAQVTRAKLLAESDYGRKFGWYVEYKGQILGELHDARSEDMFWDSYSLTSTCEAHEAILFDEELWMACRFQFQNIVMKDYAASAFCGRSLEEGVISEGRVLMRGLYLCAQTQIEKNVLRWLVP